MAEPGGPVPAVIDGSGSATLAGALVADWIAATSHGNAHVAVGAVDGIDWLAGVRHGFDSELSKVCARCSVTTVQIPTGQAFDNQGNPLLVSALQCDPRLNYVFTVDGTFFSGLASALSSAGLSGRVTITSAIGDVQNQTQILAGQEGVTMDYPYVTMGWMIVDAALRAAQGMSYPVGYGTPPVQILAKANSDQWKISKNFQVPDAPANYADIFKRLWHVAGG
jgi:hypothetical protein